MFIGKRKVFAGNSLTREERRGKKELSNIESDIEAPEDSKVKGLRNGVRKRN